MLNLEIDGVQIGCDFRGQSLITSKFEEGYWDWMESREGRSL